ncbi:imidazole glycerol phosphate synthase, glutamineamidotransferase subunit [Synechococcus sp. WH 8103]|nr:imidazole glycerol phosphate synthase, glutamineamidotransferase subunit [Synechococcus sp. WH 8103]
MSLNQSTWESFAASQKPLAGIKIGVIDVGLGNIGSVIRMLSLLGADVLIDSSPDLCTRTNKLILPGAGSYDCGVNQLLKTGWFHELKRLDYQEFTLLGICLGMQLLCESSEEGMNHGLGLIPGHFTKISISVPQGKSSLHVGWNNVTFPSHSPLKCLSSLERYYFVHSYWLQSTHPDFILSKTNFYSSFVSGVYSSGCIGVQFHPEKSRDYGMKLLSSIFL